MQEIINVEFGHACTKCGMAKGSWREITLSFFTISRRGSWTGKFTQWYEFLFFFFFSCFSFYCDTDAETRPVYADVVGVDRAEKFRALLDIKLGSVPEC